MVGQELLPIEVQELPIELSVSKIINLKNKLLTDLKLTD